MLTLLIVIAIVKFMTFALTANAVKGYRSRSQAYCFETWNIASIWLSKTSKIQRVFLKRRGLQHGARGTRSPARTTWVARGLVLTIWFIQALCLVKLRNNTNAA